MASPVPGLCFVSISERSMFMEDTQALQSSHITASPTILLTPPAMDYTSVPLDHCCLISTGGSQGFSIIIGSSTPGAMKPHYTTDLGPSPMMNTEIISAYDVCKLLYWSAWSRAYLLGYENRMFISLFCMLEPVPPLSSNQAKMVQVCFRGGFHWDRPHTHLLPANP